MQKQPEKNRKTQRDPSRMIRLGLAAVLVCMLVYGGSGLVSYFRDLQSEKTTAAELKEIYYGAAETEAPGEEPAAAVETGPEAEAALAGETPPAGDAQSAGEEAPAAEAAATEATAPAVRLKPVPYPSGGNSSRIRELQSRNDEIVGWLKLDRMLEEAVVQRDNVFYMTHDVRKRKNSNGAIFLDAAVSLETRPYTLLLYGHNMKSGAMFGCLRNYENLDFYRQNCFLTFESEHEAGRYAVFAAGSIGIEEGQANYIDVFWMLSDRADERQRLIRALRENSEIQCGLEVLPEDQLILLVTCVDSQEQRRVVAARRLRPEETEQGVLDVILKTAVQKGK